ncbi:accessory gene regulator B [Sedimentibacter acidaminivorans]|uniref:Accessory gene regulator B n=1 Tax=Sedimentibacter acidaminivorans TaxID=913099 RepID=A0ABS4GCQ1_9FIRM|nr:accessory gene regulator B family protein [Sedimentibacter acidaminivorans]MBP1925460.1 accessory gene regulator B [Sedimentibacter acidaminivorans]
MISSLSQSILNGFIEQRIISEEDRNIYEYGIEIAISYLLNFLTMITISFFMNMLIECIVFLIIFVPLKGYTGGYHAPNYIICFVISCLTVTAVLFATKYTSMQINQFILLLTMIMAGVSIYILGPIEDKNKPLTKNEYVHFRAKIKIILIIEFILAIIMNIVGLHRILFIFCSSFVITLGLSLIGYIKNRINEF